MTVLDKFSGHRTPINILVPDFSTAKFVVHKMHLNMTKLTLQRLDLSPLKITGRSCNKTAGSAAGWGLDR
jgi:hypothetical protein